jgi:hypothetical protein
MKPGMKLRCLAPGLSKLDAFDVAAILLLAGLVAIVALSYDAYAISNDEEVQQRYGELIIRYYASGFSDRALFEFDNLYLYGGLFDILATLIAKVLPLELYAIRHVLCALIGIGGIAAAWATARMIAGPRAGLIAALLLAVCGVWFGGMFNHTKDVPFASAMMAATFMMLRVLRDLPHPRARDVIVTGMLIGAALGLRAYGLLLLAYGAAAIPFEMTCRKLDSNRARLAFLGRSLLVLSPALLLAYLIMIAAWPWAALGFFNPVRALLLFSQFDYPIRTLLAGKVYEMADVPRWYVSAYLLIKLPLIVSGGMVLALLFALSPRLSRSLPLPRERREIAMVAFTVAFPVLAHAVAGGPAFTGMRHFLFVVPPIAVLAGIGCDALMKRLKLWRPLAAAAIATVIAVAMLWNAAILVRLHPYEYLFYNSLVGGLEGAAGRYDTDYWVNIMPEAVRELDRYLAREEAQSGGSPGPYYVDVCAERLPFDKVATARLRWTEDWDRADFFISPTHMDCDRMLDGKVIISITRLNALIGVVKDRRAITRVGLARRGNPPPAPNRQ